jgi:hypothetical protein
MSDGITEAWKGFDSYKKKKESDEITKLNIEKTFIFRVRVDKFGLKNPNIITDADGYMYISTNNPSAIYEMFGAETVLSIEKISSGYII